MRGSSIQTTRKSFKVTDETVIALDCLLDNLYGCETTASTASATDTGLVREQLQNIVFLVDKGCFNAIKKNGSSNAAFQDIGKTQKELSEYRCPQSWAGGFSAFSAFCWPSGNKVGR